MSSIQYTVRNVPEQVDRYLRRLSSTSGKSLNQVIIEELNREAEPPPLSESLKWFIGSGFDEDVALALEEEDRIQKSLAKKDGYYGA
jgi:hypothetical protein